MVSDIGLSSAWVSFKLLPYFREPREHPIKIKVRADVMMILKLNIWMITLNIDTVKKKRELSLLLL